MGNQWYDMTGWWGLWKGQLKVGGLRGDGIQYLGGRLVTRRLAVHVVVVPVWLVAVVGLGAASLPCVSTPRLHITQDSPIGAEALGEQECG